MIQSISGDNVGPDEVGTAKVKLTRRAVAVLASFVAVWLTAVPLIASSDVKRASVDVSRVPEGLSTSDWSSIRAIYELNRHAANQIDDGYQTWNPGQQWRTRFDGRGFLTTPDSGGWTWGLELVSYGRGAAHRSVVTPGCVIANGPRVEYEWDDTLTEWYVNDQRGLEHGYTVSRRPEDGADLVQITLSIRGDLHPQISGNGRDITFIDSTGTAAITYNGLTVFDATGTTLPAKFEIAPTAQVSGLEMQAFSIVLDDSNAIYPITIDPIAQQAYIKASNTEAGDQFGYPVAVSGDTVVVGAVLEDSNATGVNGNQADNSAPSSGAAYVFVRNGGVWSQQAYLKASNTQASDYFGFSAAVSGDTVIIGATGEDSNAVGVSGNQSDNSASNAGAVYVFTRSGTTWNQQAYLKASNTGAQDHFGISVAVSGDLVVVGAYWEDSSAMGVNGNQANNGTQDSGAAYIFVRTGGVWSQQAYLKASNTGAGDFFGQSVAVSDDTVVVGANFEASNATGVNGNQANNSALTSGAAYVFVRNSGVWNQQAYLKASNTGVGDRFGSWVSVSGDTLVVGAYLEDSGATGVNGNQGDNSAEDSGAAYVFVRSGGVWGQQAYLKASNTEAFDEFGVSVGVSVDTVVVGARFENSYATGVNGDQSNNSAGASGAAYVFVCSGGVWSQQAYLKASNTGVGDFFGNSVGVSADTIVVGADLENSNAIGVNGDQADNSAMDSGAAYVFTGVGCPILGNMNCDCAVDLLDVDPFILALLDPIGYATLYPACNILRGDIQPNGGVDGGDVQGFLSLLIP